MTSDMPYLGVAVPPVRALAKAAARDHPPASVDPLAATAAALWRAVTSREHRYAATALTGLRLAEGSLTLLPLFEQLPGADRPHGHYSTAAHRREGVYTPGHVAHRVRWGPRAGSALPLDCR